MKFRFLFAAAALMAVPVAAHAADERFVTSAPLPARAEAIPSQLDDAQRAGYRAAFAAIRAERWLDARLALDAMQPGPLHAIATAELYLARNSPKVELEPLLALLAQAPELPQAERLAALAKLRGAAAMPLLPATQRLVWYGAAPVRKRARSVLNDTAAALLAQEVKPFLKADDGAGAEGVLAKYAADLAPDALTEWQQKTAWIYYSAGDDLNARRLAAMAQTGSGEWAAQADWVQGLAAWRQQDCRAAQTAFQAVAQRADDTELRSAGFYWASRADVACGRPDLVEGHLQAASQYGETFYGLLARQSLGIVEPRRDAEQFLPADWKALERRPNVRVAAALVEIGETRLADAVLRQQARLCAPEEFAALTRLVGRLSLPATELWLSHNGPAGAKPVVAARYPSPDWTPDGGWRVDKALVFAHTLQESRFDATVKSPAGAYGLMQIMPAAARDHAGSLGYSGSPGDLNKPEVNLAFGQRHLQMLRDASGTQGLLPKVMAAYNAGLAPITRWASEVRDGGDPLLWIESIPYWETRGYVNIVMRNYWMYERQAGGDSESRIALAEGLWPTFPGLAGAKGVRMTANGTVLRGR